MGCFPFLTVFGGTVGPEGAAVELVQAMNSRFNFRTSRWFEQKRRTNAAISLTAGVSAAFGAPYGILLPIELGMGGRGIGIATSAISAYLATKFLLAHFSLANFDVNGVLLGFHFSILREWVGAIVVGCAAGLLGVPVIRFIRYTQEGLQGLFQTQAWMRVLAGAVLLALLFLVYRPFHQGSWNLLEEVLWLKHSHTEVALFFCMQLVSLAIVLSGFGSIGLFWPVFALGGFLGYCVNHWALGSLTDFSAASALMGGAAFWGVILDTPLSGAVLAYELTQNIHILFPCLVAAIIAKLIRRLLRSPSLIEKDLAYRGVSLIDGRSKEVLKAVSVKEAMVTDHEIVHEQETVKDLQTRIIHARYPFLPVVNTQGIYLGLLTLDSVPEVSKDQAGEPAESSLSKLVEAKDLLYRSRYRSPFVRWGDRLSDVVDVFEELPCIPVLAEDNRVVGLLFIHNVRLAYDREVARRSFSSK